MNNAKEGKTEISDRIVHAEGAGGRVVVFRVKPGFDVMEAIKQVCTHYDIRAGVITAFFGSIKRVRLGIPYRGLRFPIPPDEKGVEIVKENVLVASGSGLVSTLEDGEIEIHLHVMLYDGGLSEMPAVGGHVLSDEPVPAHGTVEVAIEEVTGVKLVRKVDDEVGKPVTFPMKE